MGSLKAEAADSERVWSLEAEAADSERVGSLEAEAADSERVGAFEPEELFRDKPATGSEGPLPASPRFGGGGSF